VLADSQVLLTLAYWVFMSSWSQYWQITCIYL